MHLHAYHRSPDAAPAGDAAPDPKKKSNAKRFLPTTQVGITALGTTAAPFYAAGVAANAALGLLWMTPAHFTALAAELATHLDTANVTRADVSPNAEAIDQLDAEINKRLGNVRTYLDGQYEDDDAATVRGYLPALGFKAQHGSYVFPKGQQDRLDALNTLLKGLDKHGLAGKKYGLAYWTKLRNDYKEALAKAGNAAGNVSTVVDTKNEVLEQVTEVLRAIYYLLRAQYPKAWKAKLRAYGYQEEGY
jgi:hypothetical protein